MQFAWVVKLNPVAYVIEGFRSIFIYHTVPAILPLIIIVGISIILCCLGYMFFSKLQKGFAEEL